ncbi:terminase gpA endonuclease subunit [Thioclava sp. 'Guangxiensis']|uniref:terminase gpA endonuclease subunit n=1 Tax=Thioclava sp. 'Guangxiensis' TaxID=3149044 RepID=UPI003877B628
MVEMMDRGASVLNIPPLPAWTQPRELLADALPLLDPPSRISVTDAAEQFMQVPIGTDWSLFDRTVAPYMVEPADITQSRKFKSVCFVGPSQSAKTTMLITVAVHSVMCAPAPVQIIHMSKPDADAWVEEKLDPMIEHSRMVRERLGRARDDSTFSRKRFKGMRLTIGYPVARQLSSRSQRLVLLTDYDHMPQVLGPKDAPEGSPYGMARQRIRTFMSRGCVLLESTPAFPVTDETWKAGPQNPHELPPVSGGIVRIYNEGTRGRFYWECRECGDLFEPHFKYLRYDNTLEPAVAGARAEMGCPQCGTLYSHRHKNEMNRQILKGRGGWLHEGTTVGADGKRALVTIDDPDLRATDVASYSLNGAAAAFASWEGIVTSYELALRQAEQFGDYTELSRVYFTERGEPYVPHGLQIEGELTTTMLSEHAVRLDRKTAPGWTRFITTSVDVQGNRFEALVMAWGAQGERVIIDRFALAQPPEGAPKARNEEGEFRALDPGRYAEDAGALAGLTARSYPVEGQPWALSPCAVAVDFNGPAGWSDHAERFWRSRRKAGEGDLWFLSIGRGGPNLSDRVWYAAPARGSKGRKARAVRLLNMATDRLKDSVMAALGRFERGPGAQHTPDWLEEEHLAELLAERRGPKGYELKAGVKRNETLDLSVQALALAEHKGLSRINWEDPPDWAVLGVANPFAVRLVPETEAEAGAEVPEPDQETEPEAAGDPDAPPYTPRPPPAGMGIRYLRRR